MRSHTHDPMHPRLFRIAVPAALVLAGCVHVKTDPIEVKPIKVTVDVTVRMEKAVDDFFGDLDRQSTTLKPN